MCFNCDEKKAKATLAEGAKVAAPELKGEGTVTPPVVETSRLYINCVCGLIRLIPAGLKPGDEFELVPCLKCGAPFKGRFVVRDNQKGAEEING